MSLSEGPAPGRRVGRYIMYEALASGGMASVHFGRMVGPGGFSRAVAVKRLLPHLARDPEFVAMFLDEARLAARIQHPNVVSTLDVVAEDGEVFLVMDYVRGDSLAGLLRAATMRGEPAPIPIIGAAVAGMLHGLHAAHEAREDSGRPLEIVHRDVSPQNVLVGDDGVPRLVDFGIAKAAWRRQQTQSGNVKGKLSYLSPEQVRRERVDRRTDLYATGVVLWESLTGQRLFGGDDPGSVLQQILERTVEPPSTHRPEVSAALDALVLRALARSPADRFATAAELAGEVERVMTPASQSAVSQWVREHAGQVLERRAKRLAEIEATPGGGEPLLPDPAATASAATAQHALPRAAEPEAPEPRRSRAPWVMGVAALLGVALVTQWQLLRAHEPQSVALPSPQSPPSPPVAVPEPVEAPPPAPAPAPEPAPAPARVKAATRARAKSPAAKEPQRDCDPPYTLDPSAAGPDGRPIKRFKPWCL